MIYFVTDGDGEKKQQPCCSSAERSAEGTVSTRSPGSKT